MLIPHSLSVKAIVRDEFERVLVLRRSASSAGNAGRWDLPGGKVDRGEDVACAVARELLEETALSATDVRLLGAVEHSFDGRVIVYLAFWVWVKVGLIRLSDEHDEFRYESVESLLGAEGSLAPSLPKLLRLL